MTIQTALVTGGAGFIGSHLSSALLQSGIDVRVLDNLSSGDIGNLQRLGGNLEFIEGDIRDLEACRKACLGRDIVFHLAALVSVPQSVQDPLLADSINTTGTLNLLTAAREQGVRRFVFTSSSAIYGDTETIPTPETTIPKPTSPYGIQKLMGEHYARNFGSLFQMETISLRYFNVYGARQSPTSAYAAAIPKFLTRILSGQSPTVFGDGEQTRDFCHVLDIVQANLLAAQTTNPDAFGQAFNIATGSRITVNHLLKVFAANLTEEFTITYAPERAGDIKHSGADISLARNFLGYEPAVPLEQGLLETADYYRTLLAK